jgi:hypothetical protein
VTRQQIIPGEYLDIPSQKEMSDAVGHNFDNFIRDLYRGVDYVQFWEYAPAGTTTSLTLPDIMPQGYAWSFKLISVQLSAAGTFAVYPAENANVPSMGVSNPSVSVGGNNEAIIYWSSNQAVLKDQRRITIVSTAGNILAWRVLALQVPTEMQGKF